MIIICPCGKELIVTTPSRIGRTKYCSKFCHYKYHGRRSGLKYKIVKKNRTWFKKGQKPWNSGVMMKKQGQYLGGYDAVHEWVETHFGKPDICEECGSGKFHEWSNISGMYKHVRSDWQRLCKKCHNRYDYEKFGARKVFYE